MSETAAARQRETMYSSDVSNQGTENHPVPDLVEYVKDYARQKPEVAALWCFGIGFVLGWKLKPW